MKIPLPSLNLESAIVDETSMKTMITAEFVKNNWVNKEFCGFAYHVLGTMSHTRKDLLKKLLQDGNSSNLFQHLTPTDVGYGLMVYIVNKDSVLYSLDNEVVDTAYKMLGPGSGDGGEQDETPANAPKTRKRSAKAGSAKSKKKSKSAAAATEEEIGTQGGVAAPEKTPRPARRLQAKNIRQSDTGYDRMGILFYTMVSKAMSEIDPQVWQSPWQEYWTEERRERERCLLGLRKKESKACYAEELFGDMPSLPSLGDSSENVDLSSSLDESMEEMLEQPC